MKRDLLSMRQQLAEKKKQMQELEMKLKTKQEKERALQGNSSIECDNNSVHYIESINDLNKKLETQYANSRRKTMEIEVLKANMREKDDKIHGEICTIIINIINKK